MTPSEKSETTGVSAPPWQRDGNGSPVEEHEGQAVADTDETLRMKQEDVPAAAPQDYHPGTGDFPAVTGTAARRLFGDASEDEKTRETAIPSASRSRPAPTALRRPGRGPRRASLQIKRFDPWSVLKLSLVLGLAMFFVWLVAVGVLYTVLDGMGVWDKLNGTYSSLVGGEGANAPTDPLISAGRVFGIAAILGAINIVLVSALATVSAFIYNVSADLAGGLEVTLSERE
ncbi:Transmembrane protein of unknown function [Amycolatopsis xylanica]|uniref:DUF3566 domain-containing protein n=1 Tax=Amycolatopsis xylanica TaxID=589385 RepID=A0A1H3AT36_9PSEU|nr:DUF3566 domain-containing protein [Amycolatopsis xylanica]SDX32857.1 Transmembrane protein of unknown function [Amycolatopsis xylanica]